MVFASVLQFKKLNSYLIICNTLLFHGISTRFLSYSTGAKDNGAYIKEINFCGAKTFAKFADFQILCQGFSHVQFSQFFRIFHFTVCKSFPCCSKFDNQFLKVYTDAI